ncbi:MAG: IS110 family transposase [Candidatus Dormibacteria bacterium]
MTARADRRGNVVGVDPHRHTLSATVVDERGGIVATGHYKVSGDGHRGLEAWALSFGPVVRWGIEGASGLGRHTSMYLCRQGHDVRDVNPTRTAERARGRFQGKTDALDSERIARETLAHPELPAAFKRAGEDSGPDETTELLALWHKERRSLLKTRQHLLNEADALLGDLPDELRGRLPQSKAVRPRLAALHRRRRAWPAVTALRLRLLDQHWVAILELDRRDREITGELAKLVASTGSTLDQLHGLDTRSVAELLVEVGDPRRFTEGGFGRFSGTAPLPASSGEGAGEPIRHRLNRGGNRRVNAVLHRMAVTQLRCDERAQAIRDQARRRGHTQREAVRVVRRHLAAVVYRRMIRDLKARPGASRVAA